MRIPYPPPLPGPPTRGPLPRAPYPTPHPPDEAHTQRKRAWHASATRNRGQMPRVASRAQTVRARAGRRPALCRCPGARLCEPVASPRTASAPRPHGRRLTGAHPCDARAGLWGSAYGWKSGAPPGWSRDDRPFTGSGLTTRVRVHRSRIGVTTRKHGPSEKQGTCDRINTIMPTRRLSRLELTEPSRVELS